MESSENVPAVPTLAPKPAEAPRTMGQRVFRATISIAIAHAIAKIMGLIQARVIAEQFGIKTPITDAYVIAFEGIIWMLFLVGEESLGPAFLPVFMEAKTKEGEEAAWRFTSVLMNFQLIFLAGFAALLWAFPGASVNFLLSFKDEAVVVAGDGSAERTALAVHFLHGMAPALVGMSLGSLTYMVLNGYKLFFWPAFADACMKIAMTVGIVLGVKAGWSSDALIAGVLCAGAMKIAVHIFALGGRMKFYRPTLDFKDPNVRKFIALMLPLLVGIIFAKVRDNYNNLTVLSKLNDEGWIGVNSFGKKIFNAISNLIPYPLSLAMFPFLCELVARDDREAMGAFLTRASRMLMLFFMPFAAVIAVLSIPMSQALYQTGKVTPAEAIAAGQASACYSAVLPFLALEMIYMQAYFSSRRVWSVTMIGIFSSTLSMISSYVGVVVLGYKGADAVMWIACSITVSRAVKATALALILKLGRIPMLPAGPTFWFLVRTVILSAACAGVAWAVLSFLDKGVSVETAGSLRRNLPRLGLPALAACVVFVIGCLALKLEEAREMYEIAREKLQRRKTKAAQP